MFLDAIIDMKDKYVYMPRNISDLNPVSSCYGVAGLPGCMGSMMLSMLSGQIARLATSTVQRVKIGGPAQEMGSPKNPRCNTGGRRRI